MVDFIFAVKDSEQWHKENLKLNSNHYSSFAKILGNKKVSEIQRNYGAQIYYNVGFEIDDEVKTNKEKKKQIIIVIPNKQAIANKIWCD